MGIQQKINILQSHLLFSELTNTQVENFVARTKEKVFAPKTIMLNQFEPANAVYFIYKGLVKIYIMNEEGKIIPIRVKGPMYIIGEMNLFDNESTASIETLQETHTLVFTKEACTRFIKEHPSFAFNLLKILNEKLRAANKQTNYYFSFRLKERTMGTLKVLAPHFINNEISLSQEELSYLVGATRPRVTEILAQLAEEKLIYLSHRRISLL